MKYTSQNPLWLTLLLLLSCIALAFLLVYGFYICTGVMACVILFELYAINRYLSGISRSMEQFVWSVRYSDFLTSYSGSSVGGASTNELNQRMEEALAYYKANLQKKESRLQYFQALANHIDVSVIVFTPEGKIEWMNHAATILLGFTALDSIDELDSFYKGLPARLYTLKPGDLFVIQVTQGEEVSQLALSGLELVIQGRPLMVVSMRNIRSVLEDQEIRSWQKLIRVLTHEIMNSMTPIVSLSGILASNLGQPPGSDAEQPDEMRRIVETIHRRSNGLLSFVERYRQVAHIPSPVFQVIQVGELLDNVVSLMQIGDEFVFPEAIHPTLSVIADKSLIEQVLINLVKNAREACPAGRVPRTLLSAGYTTENRPFIRISDNGCGIEAEVMERIFIPFFTTKPSGSGIGLSISRQIMHLHRGNIAVTSFPGEGCTFTLLFPPAI